MARKNRPAGRDEDETPRRGLRRSIRRDAGEDAAGARPARVADSPPVIQLRRLPVEQALAQLELSLRIHRHQGTREVLVVHGKGLHSPGGQPVIAPLVRDWCREHPDIVAATREAPPAWGGEGALVLTLRPAAERTPR